MDQVIAERSLLCQAPEKEATPINIKIFCPQKTDENRWSCKVAVVGLYEDQPLIEGVDSFQALNLAFSTIKQGLEQFHKSGGKLLWQDGSGELKVEDIFA